MNVHRLRTIGHQTAVDALAALALATTARGSVVHRIQCPHCGTWVKRRRYDPTYNTCTTCLPAAKARHRNRIREHERRLGLI